MKVFKIKKTLSIYAEKDWFSEIGLYPGEAARESVKHNDGALCLTYTSISPRTAFYKFPSSLVSPLQTSSRMCSIDTLFALYSHLTIIGQSQLFKYITT